MLVPKVSRREISNSWQLIMVNFFKLKTSMSERKVKMFPKSGQIFKNTFVIEIENLSSNVGLHLSTTLIIGQRIIQKNISRLNLNLFAIFIKIRFFVVAKTSNCGTSNILFILAILLS